MISWTDKMGPRSRKAWLLLVTATGEIHEFSGESIPRLCMVEHKAHKQNGKWSGYYYQILLAPGVRTIPGHNGWEDGTFLEGLASASCRKPIVTWSDAALALGVSVEQAQAWMRVYRMTSSSHLDALDCERAELLGGAFPVFDPAYLARLRERCEKQQIDAGLLALNPVTIIGEDLPNDCEVQPSETEDVIVTLDPRLETYARLSAEPVRMTVRRRYWRWCELDDEGFSSHHSRSELLEIRYEPASLRDLRSAYMTKDIARYNQLLSHVR